MKKLFLLGVAALLSFSFVGCKKDAKTESTYAPASDAPTEIVATDSAIETEQASETEIPTAETKNPKTPEPAEATEIPLDFQKAGWISANESITLLKMYLGSYDDSGNEFVFEHESTLFKDGKYYYNFRITSLIVSDTGLAHKSYYANYLVSTDGIDIFEYTIK